MKEAEDTDETQTKSFPKKQTSALHSKIINSGKMWVIITLAIEKGLGSIQDQQWQPGRNIAS